MREKKFLCVLILILCLGIFLSLGCQLKQLHRIASISPHNQEQQEQEQIPRIIHQMYKNESIVDRWKASQQTCLYLHNFTYRFWTDASLNDFIRDTYPTYLE